MNLDGKRFAVLVEDQYEDQELWYPVQRLREAGAVVTILGPEAGTTYQSKYGYPAVSDKAADDVSAEEFDGVIIPGGYAPDRMRRHKSMVALVSDAFAADKVVAAICHGALLLLMAGTDPRKQPGSDPTPEIPPPPRPEPSIPMPGDPPGMPPQPTDPPPSKPKPDTPKPVRPQGSHSTAT